MSNQLNEDIDFKEAPASRNWVKVILWSVAGLILAAAIAAWPVYRALKHRRAQKLLDRAEISLVQRNLREAYELAQAAYRLTPNNPRTLRFAARMYATASQESSISFWTNLLASAQSTLDDKEEFIDTALKFARYELIEPELEALLKERPEELDTLGYASQYYFQIGERAKALYYCRKALEKDPAHAPARLMLVQLLLLEHSPEELAEARRVLSALIEGSDQSSLEAILLFARLPDLTSVEARDIIRALSTHPLTRPEHQLLALDLKMRLDPSQASALMDATFSLFKTAPRENQLAAARWFNQRREYQRTVDLVSVNNALAYKDLMLARMDAMAGLGQWEELGALLKKDNLPLEPVLVELYLARVARETGDKEKAEFHWRRAHGESLHNIKALKYLAQYAERMGETEQAVKAYKALTKDRSSARQAYEQLVAFGEAKGNTREQRDLMREMAAAYPTDPIPKNDLAYLNLLLREDIPASLKAAQELVAESPNKLACRITLALAYLRANEPAKAKAVFDDVNVNWAALPGSWQAVHAAARGANGENSLARVLVRPIAVDKLKAEERNLILLWID